MEIQNINIFDEKKNNNGAPLPPPPPPSNRAKIDFNNATHSIPPPPLPIGTNFSAIPPPPLTGAAANRLTAHSATKKATKKPFETSMI